MTNKLFRTLKITCLCMALTAALPIVSFADEQTAVNENKKVVTIIHLDENGNPLEEDKQTETTTESSEEKNTDDTAADSAETEEAETDADEENADDEEVLEAEVDVEDDLRSEIVTYALQFVGNRYKYGGTNPNTGVDCSGFTMRVMEKFGVSLPHYSGSQAQMGKKVTSATMKPGDLIFYAGSNGKVNHVAIYIGNGRIVHAASRRSGIKTSTWNYRTSVAIRSMLD